jgi:hypothetical protein
MVLRMDITGVAAKAAAPLFVEQRNVSDGTLVGSPIALPTPANPGSNMPVMLSSVASSEGGLSLSVDGHYLMLGGYGATAAQVSNSTAIVGSTAPRVVARINAAGTVETFALSSLAFATDNLRGVVSTNGTDFWASGAGSSGSGGVWYGKYPVNGTGSNGGVQVLGDPTVTPPPPAQARICGISAIDDGDPVAKLYCDSSKSPFGIFQVGVGVPPQATRQLANLLPGMPGVSGPSPFAFTFIGTDTLYVADDNPPGSAGGGVQKWTKSNGTWSKNAADTLSIGTVGARGLSVFTSGSNRTILASTADADGSGNVVANTIVKFVDTGSGAPTATTLVAATANQILRGLALPPN